MSTELTEDQRVGVAPDPQGETAIRRSVACVTADYLAPKIVAALLSIRPAEARIVRRQATLLAFVSEGRRYQHAGFSRLGTLAQEILQLSPSTTRERIALDRVLRDCPLAETAFLEGRLTVCQVDALGPVLRATGSSGSLDRPRS